MHQRVQIERVGATFDRGVDHFFDLLQGAGSVHTELETCGVKRHRFLREIGISRFRFGEIGDQLLAAFFVCFAIQPAFVLGVERAEKQQGDQSEP